MATDRRSTDGSRAVPVAAASSGPPVALSPGPLGAVQAVDREIGRLTAQRCRALVAFARSRPSSVDRQPGQPGCASAASRAARAEVLAPVSEWAAQELVVALSVTHQTGERQLAQALVLVEQLPATLAALEAGTIHVGHLPVFVDNVAAIDDPAVRATVERDLLAWIAGRVKTPAQLRDRAGRVILRLDAQGAARRLEKEIRRRGVFDSPGRVDGISQLTAVLTTPESRACLRVLGAYVDSIDDTDLVGADGQPLPPRTRGQKMADVLCDLILRPGQLSAPLIQAQLLIVASVETLAGGDQPGEVDGQTVPAEMVRHLARAFGLVPDTAAEATPTPPATDDDTPDQQQPPLDPPVGAPARYRVADPRTGWRDAEPWEREWLESIERAGAFSDVPAGAEAERRFLEEIWALEAGVPAQTPAEPAPAPAPAPARSGHEPAPSPKTAAPPDARRAPSADWSVADAAVRSASAAVEEARRAVALADRQVEAAEHRAADDEDAWAASTAGQVTGAADSVRALAAASTEQRAAIAGLLTRTGGGGLVDRPRVAVVDAFSGTLLALTDAAELRRLAHCGRPACARRSRACTHVLPDAPGLAPPPETDGYRPGAALDRFVRARDRRCRFPGCRQLVPRGGEVDHDRPYPDGPTAADNLAGYCTRNHRGKHQAPGWTHVLHPDGRLTVTTLTGLTTTTTPEDYSTRPLTTSAEPAPF